MEAYKLKDGAVEGPLDVEQDPDPHQTDPDPQLCLLGICFTGALR
jgi:hypothetical protein